MNYKNLFYFDIETVSNYNGLNEFKVKDNRGYKLFLQKIKRKNWTEEPNVLYDKKASLMPEYGKIVCVSMAIYKDDELRMRSIYDDDEETLMKKVHKTFSSISKNTVLGTCGYYIKGFDIPWLNRKMMKYGLKIPNIIKTFNVKPWEMNVFDLADIWRSNGTLEYVSFDEMLNSLDVDSPKSDISGADVTKVYWEDNNLIRIKEYCENDVIACVDAAKKISDNI
jgi:predicted PolB exonuclease-like 3'-5' exonuclease